MKKFYYGSRFSARRASQHYLLSMLSVKRRIYFLLTFTLRAHIHIRFPTPLTDIVAKSPTYPFALLTHQLIVQDTAKLQFPIAHYFLIYCSVAPH